MAPNTIVLNTVSDFIKEAPLAAGKAITPGMWLQYTSGAATVEPHSSSSAVPAPRIIAVELPIRSGSGIDDDYDEDGEAVAYHFAAPGDELYCLLEAGDQATLGELLESNGAGLLQTGSEAFVRALEAVDNSGSCDPARIRVEVI
jgi:hypothetical protein